MKRFGLNPKTVVANAEQMRATNVVLRYTMPGTDITSRGGPWPFYSGVYDFHHLTGSLEIPNTNSYRLPTPVSWTLNRAGSTLVTTVPQPFTHYSATQPVKTQPSLSSRPNSSNSIYREQILFSRIDAASALDPVETYQAVVSNPSFWVGILGSITNVLSRSNRTIVDGKSVRIYDVLFDLNYMGYESTSTQRLAMNWLSGYLGTHTVAGQLSITSKGAPVMISLIRSLRIPSSARGFPNPALHPTLSLQIVGRADTSTSSSAVSDKSFSTILGGPKQPTRSHCIKAGRSGLTAAIVARSGERISGSVDANGCDVGVYIPTGSSKVTVSDSQIIGAATHAILAVDSTKVTISRNLISDRFANAIDLTLIPETKAIMLVGTSHSSVSANTGVPTIGIVDNGNVNSTAINPGTPAPSYSDLVQGNQMSPSLHADCVILVASFNPGEGVTNNTVSDNQFSGTIVIATDAKNTSASGNVVEYNQLVGAFLPGIVIHLNGSKDVASGNIIKANILSADSSYVECGLTSPAGIAIIGAGAPAVSTMIEDNVISQEQVGIWLAGARDTTLSGNRYSLPTTASNYIQSAKPVCAN